MEPAVKTKDLRHTYGTHTALAGVSLEVGKGTIFGLLGPNGSGKTTLFRILSTALLPGAGEAWIEGLDLRSDAARARSRIGVVFQSPSLDGKLTVHENLLHQGYLYGLTGKKLRERSSQMLSQLGIADRAKDLAGSLSGGLKRRVELAKGLLHNPSVLLLDEPSTGLDPGARIDLWRYLKALRDESGITVLVTTHLMEEAEHCGRLSIMHKGKVIRSGAPVELKKDVGGDVIILKSPDLAGLGRQVAEKFSIEGRMIDGALQIEHKDAANFVARLIETFPGLVESVTFRHPTLEDVFVHHTGHEFWSPEPEPEKKDKKKHA